MKCKFIVLTIFIILLTSCSFINENEEQNDIIEHPDLILKDVSYTIKRDVNSSIKLASDQVEIYNKTNLTKAQNVDFIIEDDNGESQITGKCDKIEINTDNFDVKLKGNVIFKILDPVLEIYCDTLDWNNENSILNTQDEQIKVISDNSTIIGSGLSLNIDTRYFEFKEITKGELYEK